MLRSVATGLGIRLNPEANLLVGPMVRWRKTFPAAVGGFALYCLRRYGADGCPRVAASLSYASLLASIPLLAIAFGVLSYLPLFDDIYIEILDGIFANFLPEAGLEISEQVVVFLENARELTGVGFLPRSSLPRHTCCWDP